MSHSSKFIRICWQLLLFYMSCWQTAKANTMSLVGGKHTFYMGMRQIKASWWLNKWGRKELEVNGNVNCFHFLWIGYVQIGNYWNILHYAVSASYSLCNYKNCLFFIALPFAYVLKICQVTSLCMTDFIIVFLYLWKWYTEILAQMYLWYKLGSVVSQKCNKAVIAI